ncbi:endonuclease domain-containing protein [Agromyces atrinae]|uniref:Very-short-patch-repair endonuclease n=1 Tax=Agromyces atrinae TaxID=592376 RepID=A0A852SJ26_9MICO|nr:DUF559 domain-containing protein [Agromyces atrinae]NYD68545.1 very-short-patch-repair endonuclease [Agromyces atrinae]
MRGVWAIDDGALHVSVPGNQPRLRRSAAGDDASPTRRVRAHWDDGQRRREAIVGVPRMLRQIARCQPEEMAVAAFDSSIRLGLLSSDELAELAASSTAQFRRIVEAVDGRADSGIESLPRVRLARLGIEMVPQVKIDGHRVDGLVGERLVLQFDGFGPHSSRHQRNKDLAEDARLTSRGYTVLRFSYDQVIRDWEWVESEVLRAVEHGRHRWPM